MEMIACILIIFDNYVFYICLKQFTNYITNNKPRTGMLERQLVDVLRFRYPLVIFIEVKETVFRFVFIFPAVKFAKGCTNFEIKENNNILTQLKPVKTWINNSKK